MSHLPLITFPCDVTPADRIEFQRCGVGDLGIKTVTDRGRKRSIVVLLDDRVPELVEFLRKNYPAAFE